MQWGTHVKGSDAYWRCCTSAKTAWSSMCPQTPPKWRVVCSLTSLPGARALVTSPGMLQVQGNQAAWLVCSKFLDWVPEPCNSAWEHFGSAMWPRQATNTNQRQSLFSVTCHCLLLHPTQDRERPCRKGKFGYLVFMLHESRGVLGWGQHPEPLEVSWIILNLCEGQLLPTSIQCPSFTGFWIGLWFASPIPSGLVCVTEAVFLPSFCIFFFSYFPSCPVPWLHTSRWVPEVGRML